MIKLAFLETKNASMHTVYQRQVRKTGDFGRER